MGCKCDLKALHHHVCGARRVEESEPENERKGGGSEKIRQSEKDMRGEGGKEREREEENERKVAKKNPEDVF